MSVKITILDNGKSYEYGLSCPTHILGRQYDNNSETIVVNKPSKEADNTCTMIVSTTNGQVIKSEEVTSSPVNIDDTMSKYLHILIGFSFSNETGYVKNTGFLQFNFLPAQAPITS